MSALTTPTPPPPPPSPGNVDLPSMKEKYLSFIFFARMPTGAGWNWRVGGGCERTGKIPTMRDVLRQQAVQRREYGVRDGLPGKTKRRGGEEIDFPHPVTIPPAKRKYHGFST